MRADLQRESASDCLELQPRTAGLISDACLQESRVERRLPQVPLQQRSQHRGGSAHGRWAHGSYKRPSRCGDRQPGDGAWTRNDSPVFLSLGLASFPFPSPFPSCLTWPRPLLRPSTAFPTGARPPSLWSALAAAPRPAPFSACLALPSSPRLCPLHAGPSHFSCSVWPRPLGASWLSLSAAFPSELPALPRGPPRRPAPLLPPSLSWPSQTVSSILLPACSGPDPFCSGWPRPHPLRSACATTLSTLPRTCRPPVARADTTGRACTKGDVPQNSEFLMAKSPGD